MSTSHRASGTPAGDRHEEAAAGAPGLPDFAPYREDLPPWLGEGLVRLRVRAVPSAGRADAVRESLDAWMRALTRDDASTLPPEQSGLWGAAVIERECTADDERIVIFSGGQDGIESAGGIYEDVRETLVGADPQITGTLHEDRPSTLEELEATRDPSAHPGTRHG